MNNKLFFLYLTAFASIFYSKTAVSAITSCYIDTVYTSCNAGFYLSGGTCLVCSTDTYKDTVGAETCTPCPYLDDVQGHTSGTAAANHDSITDCFVLSGTGFSDISGSYSFTSNCYYSN